MNDGSKFLLRANPALTTNVKLVVDSKYNLYLESYNANKEISDNAFKMQMISSSSFLSERIATFWKGIPSDLAFQTKNDIKSDTIQNNLDLQYDDIYYSGMRKVEDIRYFEEFQYNTTLKINPQFLPKHFFIFRVDGPGIINILDSSYIRDIIDHFKVVSYFNLSKETNIGKLWQKNYIDDDQIPRSPVELNFKKYEFSKWNGYDYKSGGTTSKSFFMDEIMRNQTTHFEFEKFITNSFQKNEIVCSNYSNISFLFDDTVSDVILTYDATAPIRPDGSNTTEYDIDQYSFLHDYITQAIIKPEDYSLITQINGKTYLRSTRDFAYRKRWTINRYFGFYVDDIEYISRISPYVPTQLILDKNIQIVDNKFLYGGVGGFNVDPTVNGVISDTPSYIKIDKDYYPIELNTNGEYVIVSDINFNFNSTAGTGNIVDVVRAAEKSIKIVPYTFNGVNYNVLKYIDDTIYHVYGNKYSTKLEHYNMVYLIKIYDVYYKLNKLDIGADSYWTINADDWFKCDGNQFIRRHTENKEEIRSTQVLSKNDTIPFFEIYRIQFTEIGDFDFQRDITGYANIEYDLDDQVSYKRPFLREKDFNDLSSSNKNIYEERGYQIDTYFQGSKQFGFFPDAYNIFPSTLRSFIIPITSEYGACGDLYMLDKQSNIGSIWDINQSVNKWGWVSSQSNCSYPYKINNSLDYSSDFNFSPNPWAAVKDSQGMSHDWFYCQGAPIIQGLLATLPFPTYTSVPYDGQYTYYTLNIEPPFNTSLFQFGGVFVANNFLDSNYKINLEYYLDSTSSFDWFTWYFNTPLKIRTYRNIGGPPAPTAVINDGFKNIYIDNINRLAYFTKTDNANGPQVLFRGINAYIEHVNTVTPNSNLDYTTTPANEFEGYAFAAMFDTKEIGPYIGASPNPLIGKAGIDIIVNKKHKNVLIFVWVYAPHKSYSSISYNTRDIAMQDDYVSYSFFDNVLGAWTTNSTELPMSALSLNHITRLLNTTTLSSRHFSQGIKYTVVEDREEWLVRQTYPGYSTIYDPIDDLTTFTIKLDHYLGLKHGDWIYVKGVAGMPDGNYQITGVIRQFVYQFGVGGNFSTVLLSDFANAIITKEQSVLPFRLRCVYPDEVKIDVNVNVLKSDISCPVTPSNTLKNIGSRLIFDRFYDKDIVNNMWIDNPINRRIEKITRDRDLTPSQIDKLPSIFRYSGDYEPITVDTNLFDRPNLGLINIQGSNNTWPTIVDFYTTLYNGRYHLTLKYEDIAQTNPPAYDNLLEQLKVGDIVYTQDPAWPVIIWADINSLMLEVVAISKTLNPLGYYVYEIVTTKKFNTNVYPFLGSPFFRAGLSAHFFFKIKPRTTFKYDNNNFGINKSVIISKQWLSVNPLKTSAPVYNVKNKWAMIDEHGVSIVDRNIFRSSWDLNYYYETNKNVYGQYPA